MRTNQNTNAIAKAATMALMEPLWPKVNEGADGTLDTDDVNAILGNSQKHYPVGSSDTVFLADETPDDLGVAHFVKPYDERATIDGKPVQCYEKTLLIRNHPERGNLVERMIKMAGICRLPIKRGSKLGVNEVNVSLGLRVSGEDFRLSPVRLLRAVKHQMEEAGLKPVPIVVIKGHAKAASGDEECPF